MVFVVHPDGPRELTVLSVEYVQLKLRTTVKNYSGAPGRVTYRTEVIEFPLGGRATFLVNERHEQHSLSMEGGCVGRDRR
jgi:hypothetical protein